MKKRLFQLFFIAFIQISISQELLWVSVKNYTDKDLVHSVCGCDKSGNFYYIARLKTYSGTGGAYTTNWRLNKHRGEDGKIEWEVDGAGMCVTDSSGNTIVAGGSFVNKFDLNGKLVLSVEDPNASFMEPALMPDGGFAVTGFLPKSFLRRYDKLGNLLWHIEDDRHGGPLFAPVATDREGNIYLYTYGPANPVNMGRLIKFRSDGVRLFEKTVPHQRGEIIADPLGGVLLLGQFDPDNPIEVNGDHPASGNTVMKFDADGNLRWFRRFNTVSRMWLSATIDGNGKTYLMEAGGPLVIEMLDESGNSVNSITLPQRGSNTGISVDLNGNIIIASRFTDRLHLGDVDEQCQDYGDIFIVNLDASSMTTALPNSFDLLSVNGVLIYPNPSGDLFTVQLPETESPPICRIKDVTGRFIGSIPAAGDRFEVNLKEQPAGIYILELEAGGRKVVRKLVKQ